MPITTEKGNSDSPSPQHIWPDKDQKTSSIMFDSLFRVIGPPLMLIAAIGISVGIFYIFSRGVGLLNKVIDVNTISGIIGGVLGYGFGALCLIGSFGKNVQGRIKLALAGIALIAVTTGIFALDSKVKEYPEKEKIKMEKRHGPPQSLNLMFQTFEKSRNEAAKNYEPNIEMNRKYDVWRLVESQRSNKIQLAKTQTMRRFMVPQKLC